MTKEGVPRFRTESDRAGNKWRIREIKVQKSYEFRDKIAREVIQVFRVIPI